MGAFVAEVMTRGGITDRLSVDLAGAGFEAAILVGGIILGGYVDRTKEYNGTPIPVIVTVYNDRSFDFITKSPPAASMLKQAAGIAKGSGVPNKDKVAKVTREQCAEIAEKKMADLNARSIDQAVRMIEGTARSMGIEVEG